MSGAMHTDPVTGAKKTIKLARYDLVPADALHALAEHYGKNSATHGGKYPDRNWERGYAWSLSFAALCRHLFDFWRGEEFDDEGKPNLDSVMWHAFALKAFSARGIGRDDRPVPEPIVELRRHARPISNEHDEVAAALDCMAETMPYSATLAALTPTDPDAAYDDYDFGCALRNGILLIACRTRERITHAPCHVGAHTHLRSSGAPNRFVG